MQHPPPLLQIRYMATSNILDPPPFSYNLDPPLIGIIDNKTFCFHAMILKTTMHHLGFFSQTDNDNGNHDGDPSAMAASLHSVQVY